MLAALGPLLVAAQQTETLYLSGKGLDDTKTWEFYCSGGMNSGKWMEIGVPSQWELQGFGEYSYGRWYTIKGAQPPTETGIYRTTFHIPPAWRGKQITIVFEGSMTDTEVTVNGLPAGDIHRGGFNRFAYTITDKIVEGKNDLEVKVAKESSDRSVNAAERKADWWIFGGIYRPVYLEAKPPVNIERIAVDARADGTLAAEVFTTPLEEGYTLVAGIRPVGTSGKSITKASGESTTKASGARLKRQTARISAGNKHTVQFRWDGIRPWNTETPELYDLTLELTDQRRNTIHVHRERIGFRTVEFRMKDGIYLNGTKIVLKGINRHSFHPDGGRTTSKAISIADGKLIKEMHMNAVRTHYAPDKHFLDACDSLGLFVISELAGWQNAYSTEVGSKRVKELVTHQVNHPSIILWSNGNEGGFNGAIDPLFREHDPQKRHVIHAWADFDNLDTHHYPTFLTGIARFINGYKVFMPTEFQHGMYDQGHGAGLEDFWAQYTAHPLFAGGVMWDFSDNAVKRSDKGGILDSDGSNGADGILGPYRQKEGSYYTVREVWAPIQFNTLYITPSFNGKFIIRNDYLFSNLNTCKMNYRILTAPSPATRNEQKVIAAGSITLPAIDPREAGTAHMDMPANFFEGDILEIKAWDRHSNEICTWTWPIRYAGEYTRGQLANITAKGHAEVKRQDGKVSLAAQGVTITFDTLTAQIDQVTNRHGTVSFTNGPIPIGIKARVKDVRSYTEGPNAIFTVRYYGGIDSIRWEMTPAGLIRMHAVMLNKAGSGTGFDEAIFEDRISNFGLSFCYPEAKVEGMRWFGRGPYRVWRNRIHGTSYGIWEKAYNNTVTGAGYGNLIYPEFKGYHGNLYWSTLATTESPITVYAGSDGIFMRVFTPDEPEDNKAGWSANPSFPEGDISFLYEIPAMRCFKPLSQQGPKSQPSNIRIKKGDQGIHMELWFDFTANPSLLYK
jgi:hypothetical protein